MPTEDVYSFVVPVEGPNYTWNFTESRFTPNPHSRDVEGKAVLYVEMTQREAETILSLSDMLENIDLAEHAPIHKIPNGSGHYFEKKVSVEGIYAFQNASFCHLYAAYEDNSETASRIMNELEREGGLLHLTSPLTSEFLPSGKIGERETPVSLRYECTIGCEPLVDEEDYDPREHQHSECGPRILMRPRFNLRAYMDVSPKLIKSASIQGPHSLPGFRVQSEQIETSQIRAIAEGKDLSPFDWSARGRSR